MKALRALLFGIGLGLGLASGYALFQGLPAADAGPSGAKLDKRIVKLVKRAQKKGTVVGGIVIGIVTDTDDPDGLERVRVRYPELGDDVESFWANRVAPAGDLGLQFIPEVGDEVLVAFAHGDIRRPTVVGTLWSAKDPPPAK